mgnify:FL=1
MRLNIIVAIDNNNGIGKNNTLPWHFKEDLKYFSKVTKGKGNNAIIMGKNTWNSLPKKPLPGRVNIVLSSNFQYITDIKYDNTWFCNSFESLQSIPQFKNKEFDECWYIGGEKIYNTVINNSNINKILVTKINGDYDCDTFFPKIPDSFKLSNSTKLSDDLSFETYIKN